MNTLMKRILIIQDDRKSALTLALRLRTKGHEAAVADDALTGVAMAVKFKPDMVLLDVSIQAGNGFSVAESIRALVPTYTPAIFLTAGDRTDIRQLPAGYGEAAFFEKPYDAAKLRR